MGTCDLLCRRFKDELETLAFGMGLMTCYPELGREYAQAYYRTSSRMDDSPLPEMPSISRAEIEAHIPFKVYFTDETVPRLWAVTLAASVEHAEASEAGPNPNPHHYPQPLTLTTNPNPNPNHSPLSLTPSLTPGERGTAHRALQRTAAAGTLPSYHPYSLGRSGRNA